MAASLPPLVWELALAPVLLMQGRRVRRRTPVLPEAIGPREGWIGVDGGAGCAPTAPAPLRLLIAGDSAVAGVGVDRLDQAMAIHFATGLAGRLARPVRWRVHARTGLDARGLRALLEAEPVEPADLVLVAIGVNDVTGRTARLRWLADLAALRERLLADSPEAHLLWAGLPPMQSFDALPRPLNAYLGARARQLDAALARWAATDPRMNHLPVPLAPGDGMMATDGFHPGPRGHQHWGEQLAQAAGAAWLDAAAAPY
jgi:lysophospholipase L1-like esterase